MQNYKINQEVAFIYSLTLIHHQKEADSNKGSCFPVDYFFGGGNGTFGTLQVMVDGVSLKDFDPSWLRGQLGIVGQEGGGVKVGRRG